MQRASQDRDAGERVPAGCARPRGPLGGGDSNRPPFGPIALLPGRADRLRRGAVTYSALSHLECPRCGARHDADLVQGTCPCGSPLLARYDLGQVAVAPRDIAGRPPDLWRYHELLPVRAPGRVVSLGEGMTPLIPLPRLGRALGVPNLLMKDEGLIPTGTFKARGAAVGVSRAAELGVSGVAMPTNGNAGAAWSLYAAPAGGAAGDRRDAGPPRRGGAEWLSGPLAVAGAIPDRGQEDHGPGDRR